MRNTFGWALAGLLAMGGWALLAGCKSQGTGNEGIPIGPKWKGEPYRLAFDAKQLKPNRAGITIPIIKFTANPDALEHRATLVVRFDAPSADKNATLPNQMVMAPIDISGADGSLPAGYMDAADKGLAQILEGYCMKGKVKIKLALARSSLTPQATDDELNEKRLSDWLPVELVFKNPHPNCKSGSSAQ